MEDKKLEGLVESVVDTFAFQGVKITNLELTRSGVPHFYVTVSKQKRSKSLEETLNFTYWTLWTLLYGQYDSSKEELEINLSYEEIE